MAGAGVAVSVAAFVVLVTLWAPGLPSSISGFGSGAPGSPRGGVHLGPLAPPTAPSSNGASTTTDQNVTQNSSGGVGNGSGAGAGGSNSSGNGSGSGSNGSNGSGSNGSGGNGSGSNGSGSHRTYRGINGSLSLGSAVATVTPSFFQLVLQTPNLTSPTLWRQLNATPFTYFQFTGSGEITDQVLGIAYGDNGSALAPTKSNDSNFVAFCRVMHCHAIFGVPAEINDTEIAVGTVRYVEEVLGFHPDYWMIGGEPQGWTHFNIPWTQWKVTDHSTVTPLVYARELQQYVIALRAYDPSIRLIGLQSADGGSWFDSPWLDQVAAIDGPNLTALTIHPYPGGMGVPNPSVSDFYSSLANATKFPYNYQGLLAHQDAACGCSLPLWVGEYNSALGGNYSSFMTSYPEVPYIAAATAGALKAGVPVATYFSYSHGALSLVDANSRPLPIYSLFSTFFKNLTLGEVFNTSLVGGPHGVYTVATSDGSRTSVLIVNTNVTQGLNLTLPGVGDAFLPGAWQAWAWDPTELAPTVARGGPYSPSNWSIPPQGILLLNAGG